MNINAVGIKLIKEFEGLRLSAYLCPANVWTIGYGHTGKEVTQNLKWTAEIAEKYLKIDLLKFETGVLKLLKVKLNSNQFSALVSFAYNLGLGNLEESTLLKLINKNPSDQNINKEFMKWINAGGKLLPGLYRRRQTESELYFSN